MSNRNTTKITQAFADSAKSVDAKPFRIFDETVTGLCLYVGTSGSKSWYLYYTSRSNKRQSYRFGSLAQYNVADARVEARRLLGKIAGNEDPAEKKRQEKLAKASASARTLEKYLDGGYWTHYLSKRKDGKADQFRIRSIFKDFLERDMATITPAELIAHRTKRFDKGRKATTLNRDRMALHGLFEKAIKDGLIKSNPAHKSVFEPLPMVDDKRVRYLGQRDEIEDIRGKSDMRVGERQRFMDALSTMTLQIQTIVGLALNTGCRRGELFHLTWSDVSMKKQTLTVIGTVAKSKKKRVIPLNSKAMEFLHSWRKGSVTHISGLVFPSDVTGKPLKGIKRQWGNLVKEASITDFRFHDLRHDFASRLVMGGVSLYEVRDLLGHATIAMTERYAHLDKGKLRGAVEVL